SSRAISSSSALSRRAWATLSSVPTTVSSDLRSRPSSWARWLSLQNAGSSASLISSSRRARLVSKSKIPPQLGGALLQILELFGDGVDAFGFHGEFLQASRVDGRGKSAAASREKSVILSQRAHAANARVTRTAPAK